MRALGKVHLIANPAAQIGHGVNAAAEAAGMLRAALGETVVTCTLTKGPGHAAVLAEASYAQGFGAVVALGGDGIVNEVVNGLMRLPRDARPVFGLVPAGSGNDYARTLGVRFDSNMETIVLQLLDAAVRPLDVGSVNGRFFAETLSFGLDAAIALDTVERRCRTGRTGTMLYLESGLNQLLFHLAPFHAEVSFGEATACIAVPHGDGVLIGGDASDESAARDLFLMAAQVGATYGGGFSICPDARPDDGLLDVCTVDAGIGKLRGIVTFLRAKNGHHVRAKCVAFRRVRSLAVRVPHGVAVQADGERVDQADVYRIECVPAALDVLVAQGQGGAAR